VCFCKNTTAGNFGIYGINFLLKIPWNRPTDRWTRCTTPAHESIDPSLNVGHSISDGRKRLEHEGVRFLGCRNHNGWLRFNEPMI
jgi:hypothetical protein